MAGNVSLWSQTDITNQSIDSAINFAEGQAPGTVNNSARAVMSGVAAWRDDLNGTITSGGSANAQTITTNTAYAALATGIVLAFKAGFTNSAATTLTVTGASAFAAKAIRKIDATGEVDLISGDLKVGGHYTVRYDAAANGAAGAWILLTGSANTLDDYEEGTWTPALGGSATYTARTGTYKKIGKFVHLFCTITVNSIGTGSTGQITGVPFAAAQSAMPGSVGFFQNAAGNVTFVSCYLTSSTIDIIGFALPATATTDPFAFFANSTIAYLQIPYQTA